MSTRPIIDLRRRPSRVRFFCAWARDAFRWLNEPMAPSAQMRAESAAQKPAPAWMYAVLLGLLAIGALVIRLVFGFPPCL